jgi:hypothetical protein
MSAGPPDANPPAEPSPYELYIQLNPLVSAWPTGDDNWPGAIVAACGFQAAELTLRLIDDALGDVRPAAFREQRIARYVEHLVDGLELTCRLLGQAPPPGPGSADDPGQPIPSPGFAVIARLDARHVDHITSRLALACAGLPFRTGIEDQLCAARLEHGLPHLAGPGPGPDAPVMDYTAVVAPDKVFGLREAVPCGPEDHLFSTAHQITECWLRIAHHYLDDASTLAEQRQWSAAADAMATACDALPLAIQAGQLLDLMVLADYHPLRVQLRDGSGAQSVAAQQLGPAVRAAARPLWTALDIDDLAVLDILERPTSHLGLYRYLCTLKTVGKRIQGFLFDHYLLALGVLGTHSLGSAGYEIRKLAERAAQPAFPEINQAHHDYVMLTNFQYGEQSGSIVYNNELAYGWNPYAATDAPHGCPRRLIEARVADYFRCIEERDAEGWVDLFEPIRGQLHDVLGTRPYLGQARLRVFINGMFNAFSEMRGTHSQPQITGNTASVEWHFDAVSYHGKPTSLNGWEEFHFSDDGFIVNAVAHWRPSHVARQWRDGVDGRDDRDVQRRPGRQVRPRAHHTPAEHTPTNRLEQL